jgi:lysophospholipase L1-like esterase
MRSHFLRGPHFQILPALLLCLSGMAGCATPMAAPPTALDPVSSPEWTQDMARFAADDATMAAPAHPIVFTGSSSIRFWQSLATDFPGKPVLNRGFGGSQVRDAAWHADQLAIHYRPRQIVLYAGDNDIDAGRTPRQVADDVRAFIARVRRDLPDVPILFLSIKPSLARVAQLPAQREANALVRAEIAKMAHVDFVDVATPMLGADGQPRPELFGPDGLHMNAAGYALWRGIVGPHLE